MTLLASAVLATALVVAVPACLPLPRRPRMGDETAARPAYAFAWMRR